jgi:hypothetical protein
MQKFATSTTGKILIQNALHTIFMLDTTRCQKFPFFHPTTPILTRPGSKSGTIRTVLDRVRRHDRVQGGEAMHYDTPSVCARSC